MPFWRLFYHLVWSTKQRDPTINDEIQETIPRSIRTNATAMNCIAHAIAFMPDHVHIAVSIPPSLAISDFMSCLKGASSHAVNRAHPVANFAWQTEYGALTFGEKALPDVIAYIENQKSRHAENRLWILAEQESTSRL